MLEDTTAGFVSLPPYNPNLVYEGQVMPMSYEKLIECLVLLIILVKLSLKVLVALAELQLI